MKLGYTLLYVDDVEATLAHYQAAFDLERRFFAEGGGYGELQTGETTLAFAQQDFVRDTWGFDFTPLSATGRPGAFELAFLTDDVPAAYARALEHGCSTVAAPAAKPWGQVVAYVRDRNGLMVELCTPMGG